MNREQKIAIWVFGLGIIVAGIIIFFVIRGERNQLPDPEFVTYTYQSPITGDCFELVRRYKYQEFAMSVEIDCELIDD